MSNYTHTDILALLTENKRLRADEPGRVQDSSGRWYTVDDAGAEIDKLKVIIYAVRENLKICGENVDCGDHKPCALQQAIELLAEHEQSEGR